MDLSLGWCCRWAGLELSLGWAGAGVAWLLPGRWAGLELTLGWAGAGFAGLCAVGAGPRLRWAASTRLGQSMMGCACWADENGPRLLG
ncbi:UNVERIFIED_CONTAM: hypothetical protein Sradi_4886100 [Sesamum radiatum]|uniref:Uncharacterized protein n=1 Tax=Sesamum radiatum TaxID=300843 RepID=A0AAW2MBX6_SESRA